MASALVTPVPGTAHRLSGRNGLEVGLSHGGRGPRVASLKGHLNERDEELALFVVDSSTAHDQAVRTLDLVVLTPHVVGELGLGRDGARPLHREPVRPAGTKVDLCR